MKDWMTAVKLHHELVKSMADEHGDYQVIWTSLIGSQNYGLDDENSDCDTFSIVFPNYMDFISNTNLISFETEVGNGKCVVKDFRLMMNLLRKTSPNSVEVFNSKFKIFESAYEKISNVFFNPDTMFYLIHANYKHMLNAIAGMVYQLHGRNMSEGKRHSHALRLADMKDLYMDMDKVDVLGFKFEGTRTMARMAKFKAETEEDSTYYKEEWKKIADSLKTYCDNFEYTATQKSVEYTAKHLINRLQFEVTKIYLEQNNFIYKE